MPPSQPKLGEVGRKILEWWYKNKRDFPWRHERDPYRLLIAEIMLQRTKADQVVPVYLEFLRKYPTIKHLAEADLKEIESFFARLGLLWRAKRVKKMAEYIVLHYKGRIPRNREDLLKIPMIGEYMADALLSFAYGKDMVVVDSNVVRVIQRVFNLRSKGEARRDPKFRAYAQAMLPRGRAREYNWAIIDFAARTCTPRNPKCGICPLRDLCRYAKRK